MIWEAGYRNGDFQGHVYEDAVRRLREWKDHGLALYVFSSGSVHAQKLLFGYSACGDLTALFSGYFDTAIGAKRETGAYRHIAQSIGLPAGEILFLSDIREELDAAQAVGLHTCWLVRDGTLPASPPHPVARDFPSPCRASYSREYTHARKTRPSGDLRCCMPHRLLSPVSDGFTSRPGRKRPALQRRPGG
jgi:enolase-phosphatase E1